MAVTKSEADGAHPSSHYLYVPDPDKPSTWKIRVKDASGTVDRALLGPAHAALTKGFRGQKADMPESAKASALATLKKMYKGEGMDWPDDTGMSIASDGLVYRTGLIFRAGSYETQGMTITPEDLTALAAAFTHPVDAELEHTYTGGERTLLDGKLGQLVEVWAKGGELYGRLAVPSWLDPIWAEFGRKVSVVLSKATKRLQRIGLVLNPAVEDAAVMSAESARVVGAYAAFAARHDTPHGQYTLQDIHDMAARSGAVCTPPDSAGYVSRHESQGMQQIHDMAAQHGASCPGSGMYSIAVYAGSRHSRADAADIQQIHTLAVRQGAECSPDATMGAPAQPVRRTTVGKIRDTFDKWFRLGEEARELAREAGADVPEEALFTVVETQASQARREAQADEIARLSDQKAEIARERDAARQELFKATATRLQGEAAAFADGLILGNKLLPAEREGLIATYAQNGMDDQAHGAITFAGGTQGSRVELLKAMYSARPAHSLTTERMDGRGNLTVVAGGQQAPSGPDSYDDDRLLGFTATGREAIKRRQQRA